jgi:hypothetical protein
LLKAGEDQPTPARGRAGARKLAGIFLPAAETKNAAEFAAFGVTK